MNKVWTYCKTAQKNKKDKENNSSNSQGQATLQGARYGIYEQETGKLVDIIETDQNGYAKSNPVLSWNSYYLMEISPSNGYLLDKTRYNFVITTNKEGNKATHKLNNSISSCEEMNYFNNKARR